MHKTHSINHFISCGASFEEASIVLVGAPFDGTTSFRPGTRFAPPQIRIDSHGLETYSPYLDKDLEDLSICDAGDIEFPFGNVGETLANIQSTIDEIITNGKKILMIGGEHLVSLPAIRSVFNRYPDLHIIHFDAHTDLREDYMGEPLSHATVMRRVWDFLGDGRIFQFGIRSGTKSEFEWAKTHTHLNKFDASSLKDILPQLKGKPVYLTIDLDVLDPSLLSGTGTPEAGGMMMPALLNALKLLLEVNLVGADIVELAPHYDSSGVSTAVACKVIREVLLLMQ